MNTKKRNIIIGISVYVIFLIIININYFTVLISDPYNGTKSKLLYIALTTIVTVLATICILVINKKKKIKPEKLFLLLAIIFGTIYMVATPLLKGHDERYHWYKSYAVSMGNFFQVKNDEGKVGDYLPEKVEGLYEIQEDYKIMDYKTSMKAYAYASDENISNEIKFTNNEPTAVYPPIQMAPQAIGIAISRVVGLNIFLQGMCGRFTNLLFFIIMGYFSIKFLPSKKYFLLVLLLCPKLLYTCSTLSGDVFLNMVTILFTSYIFKLRKEKQPLTKKDILILTILTPCIAVSKLVYFAICGLVILLPKECFKNKKRKIIFVTFILALAVVSIITWLNIATTVHENEKAIAQKEWIFSHPISYIGVLIRGVFNNFSHWALDMVGGAMEWDVVLREPELISIIIYILLFIALVQDEKEKEEKYALWEKIVVGGIGLIIIAGIITALYVDWTSASVIGGTQITGVQGRYFMPIALMLTILIPIQYIEPKYKLGKKWIPIMIILCQIPSLLNLFIHYI